jgi:hypothetical protein
MVSFYVFDIIFLIIFTLSLLLFFKINRKNLGREGPMFLYRTKLGIKAMTWFDKKFHKTLGILRYFIVTLGFILMTLMTFLIIQTIWIYIRRPEITDQIKNVPPIAPLIPYFPELFGLQSIFPPFYFIYFLISFAFVAIVHEFSHGIYMRYSKTKIKSTGFAFLGPILGAFVEEDKNNFYKKDRFNQMSVLAAGVFANFIFGVIFYLLYIGFFYLAFSANGFVFNSYYTSQVNITLADDIYEDGNLTILVFGSTEFYLSPYLKAQLNDPNRQIVNAFYDSPAFRERLKGSIVRIDDYVINTKEDYYLALDSYSPKDKITLYTRVGSNINSYDITLDKHPLNEEEPFLGVDYISPRPKNMIGTVLFSIMNFKDLSSDYQPKFFASIFIYDLIWWLMIINFLVALFNMLPLGILDGGRFYYLTLEKILGGKIATLFVSWTNRLIFGGLILIMLVWIFRYGTSFL